MPALGRGSVAALIIGAGVVAVWFTAPYAFVDDYPEVIRERATPRPSRRAGVAGDALFLLVLVGSISAVARRCANPRPDAGFPQLALVAASLSVILGAVIVNGVMVCTGRPSRLVRPGTEGGAGLRDRRFRLSEQLGSRAVLTVLDLSADIGVVRRWRT